LRPGGKAIISTLVKGTLFEFEQAWLKVDNDKHIHDYLSTDDINSLLAQQAWSDSRCTETSKVFYFDSPRALAKELKALGANLVQGKQKKGMMTKTKWQLMEAEYARYADKKGYPATYQLLYLELTK
jgi:malonyl-CoA O-methyltransferase